MKAIPPRWRRIVDIGMVWTSGVWFGSFTTEGSHGALSWLTLVLSLLLLPICAFMLLREDEKPNAPSP
jgi:hypothetical protein